ncbi:hypothetical protein [Blautia producta]|uniref:hypothetical protein n=1 Tax=Blautia producta TaxID=33035 RepID=UPI0015F9FEA6|nr:hypothetical protein [Blautia producta]
MEANILMTPEMELEEATVLADDDYIRTLSKDSEKNKVVCDKGTDKKMSWEVLRSKGAG